MGGKQGDWASPGDLRGREEREGAMVGGREDREGGGREREGGKREREEEEREGGGSEGGEKAAVHCLVS